jgi:uncharacterized protein (TIGR00288 family)
MQDKQNIAVFVDYDNIEIGVKSTLRREFDVALVLNALKERGDLVAKFAYANWGRQEYAARLMAESAVQMVQRLPSPRGDKNGGDINLALDSLEMAFTHSHVNAFAIVSGDSDFIPLLNKLKEYGKVVYVVGGKAFTSTILQQNCHEFISYESLLMDRGVDLTPSVEGAQQQAAPPVREAREGGREYRRRDRDRRDRNRDRGGDRADQAAGPAASGDAPAEGGTPAAEILREQNRDFERDQNRERERNKNKEWKERPAPLDLALAMPLVERALQVLERRGVQPQLGLLKSTMLQLDSSFSERSFGSASFSDFVDKLKRAELVNVSGTGGRFIIERRGPARPLPEPEDALPLLRDVLETHRIELEDGVTAEDLDGWVKEESSGFDVKNYGFQGFIEFLNFAQDKSVVKIEPGEQGVTVYLGTEFYPPALPPAPPPPETDEEEDDGPQPYVEGQPTLMDPNPAPPKAKPVSRRPRKMSGPSDKKPSGGTTRRPPRKRPSA